MVDVEEEELIRLGVFVRPIERFQLPAQCLDIYFLLPLAHAHAIADEELEEIVEEFHHLTGEMLELFFGDIFFLRIFQLTLNEIIDELGSVHLAAVFINLLDDVFLDHHDQVVFI